MLDFSYYLEKSGEFGVVREVRHHICIIYGLPHVRPHEVVVFESGQTGQVFSMDRDSVEVLIFSKDVIRVGTRVTRTLEILKIPVGADYLGKVIDPFGKLVVSVPGFKEPQEKREIDVEGGGISVRSRVKTPFITGVSIIDMAVPLGQGQRELVLGDRKTGKSSFLLTTLKNQVRSGTVGIYCAIGRKKAEVKRIQEYMEKEGIMSNSVIIYTSYDDPASSIFITPYTGITTAEYFRDQGFNVLLVLDDLSTHAKFYREISLLSKRFPGRDSYPGDIFYVHARLMERAGNFKHKDKGAVAITCLPVAETFEDELGYIVTNLMGMTDGHIFFDSNLYYKGRRPAVNISLSVTRVGRQTQSALMKDITRELFAYLSNYEKMLSLSHFGGEISENVKEVVDTGDKIYKFFEQDFSLDVPYEVELVLLGMVWLKMFFGEPEDAIHGFRGHLTKFAEDPANYASLVSIVQAQDFNSLLANVAKNKETLINICRTGRP